MKIGVIDSGIGGLTVLKELIKRYPENEYIYYGDTLNNPYGEKSREELYNLSLRMINYLCFEKVDMIVIACGTISANIYIELQSVVNVKLYEVIGPVLKYINSHNEKIGIIATYMTINSGLFDKLDFKLACPKFVPLIESGNYKEVRKWIPEYLGECHTDTLILGCTHYPIIKDMLREYLGDDVKIINVGSLLELEINRKCKQDVVICYSMINDKIKDNTKMILGDIEYTIREV